MHCPRPGCEKEIPPDAFFCPWCSAFVPAPGISLLGLQVVNHQTGEIPGFGKMFVREIIGRFISGLFLGIGYYWAIFDKNAQAWHDKIAGTVVLKVPR